MPSEAERTPAVPDPLPAALAHIVAVGRTGLHDRGTMYVGAAGPGRYVVTACLGSRELVMMFARRRRGWALTAAGLVADGVPQGVRCSTLPEVMRLLGSHQTETANRSTVCAARPPRNSTLDARKNTVLRV